MEEIHERLERIFEVINGPGSPSEINLREAYNELGILVEALLSAEAALERNSTELLAERGKLEIERRRFQELFNNAPEAYLITDLYGNILEANMAAGKMLHVLWDMLKGKPLTIFIEPASRNRYYALLNAAEQIEEVEIGLVPRQSPRIDTDVISAPVYNPLGERVAIRWSFRDITEQKQSRLALIASEERLRTIFQETNVGMCLTDLDGLVIDHNPAFQSITQYEPDEVRGQPITNLIHLQDRAGCSDLLHQLVSVEKEALSCEFRILARDDGEVWVRSSISLLSDINHMPQYFLYIIENINSSKQAAEDLAETKRRLLASSESDRLNLARVLHDGPVQDLYGALYKIDMLRSLVKDLGSIELIKDAELTIKNIAGTLREICGDLRPPVLVHLGLGRAIRAHIDKITSRQDGKIAFDLKVDTDEILLPPEIKLQLYRVCQACLANIYQHAQANRVSIQLEATDHAVRLVIADNGQGFDPPEKWVDYVRQGRFGLAGAAERIETINGQFAVHSLPGQGTRVEINVPI